MFYCHCVVRIEKYWHALLQRQAAYYIYILCIKTFVVLTWMSYCQGEMEKALERHVSDCTAAFTTVSYLRAEGKHVASRPGPLISVQLPEPSCLLRMHVEPENYQKYICDTCLHKTASLRRKKG